MSDLEAVLGLRFDQLAASRALSGIDLPTLAVIEDDRCHITMLHHGIGLVLLGDLTVDAVHLHSAGHQGALAYSKPLPRSLHFAMSRAEARKLLGLPTQSGGATMDSILGRMPAWDVFIDRGHKVHLQYTLSEDAIQMVTLSKAN